MGYQESFVACSDFDYLVKKVKEKGQSWFEQRFIEVVDIVTINEDKTFETDYNAADYPAGTNFLWILGDRGYQRNSTDLLGEDFEQNATIWYLDEIANVVFDKNKNPLFENRPFTFEEKV